MTQASVTGVVSSLERDKDADGMSSDKMCYGIAPHRQFGTTEWICVLSATRDLKSGGTYDG